MTDQEMKLRFFALYLGQNVDALTNGQLSFVEIQEYSEPGARDKFFSKKPTAMTAHQQLLFQAKQTKKSSSLSALKSISGLLKDEISDEQFKEMLKDIHR